MDPMGHARHPAPVTMLEAQDFEAVRNQTVISIPERPALSLVVSCLQIVSPRARGVECEAIGPGKQVVLRKTRMDSAAPILNPTTATKP